MYHTPMNTPNTTLGFLKSKILIIQILQYKRSLLPLFLEKTSSPTYSFSKKCSHPLFFISKKKWIARHCRLAYVPHKILTHTLTFPCGHCYFGYSSEILPSHLSSLPFPILSLRVVLFLFCTPPLLLRDRCSSVRSTPTSTEREE